MTLAEPIGRNTDPDANGKSLLGRNDYVARITPRAGECRLEVMRWGLLAVLGKRHIEKGAKSRTI
jgi:hypothetical protein